MIKFVIVLILAFSGRYSISLKQVKLNYEKDVPTRKLFIEDANMPMGNVYAEQLQGTTANLNEVMNHSRRHTELKEVSSWFGDIDERLDDFRDSVSRKLNELHLALQKPHAGPMGAFGMNPMMSAMMMMARSASGGASHSGSVAPEEENEENAEGEDERFRRFRH